jgi:hypothetical protein
VPQPRPHSRDAALVELQRLHAAILASRARRGVGPEGGPLPSAEVVATQELTRRLQADAATPDAEPLESEPRSRRGWWLAVAAVALAAGAWVVMTQSQRPEVVTEAAPPRAAPPQPAPAPPPPVAPVRPIAVTLTTIRPVWLRVTVDGVRAVEREVPAGETLSFGGDRAVIVRAGDAGGVRASINGTDRGPLGKDGFPLTVPFTLDAPAAAPPQ